jgi:hypothetical protein
VFKDAVIDFIVAKQEEIVPQLVSTALTNNDIQLHSTGDVSSDEEAIELTLSILFSMFNIGNKKVVHLFVILLLKLCGVL